MRSDFYIGSTLIACQLTSDGFCCSMPNGTEKTFNCISAARSACIEMLGGKTD